MKYYLFLIVVLLISSSTFGQHKKAYSIFTSEGVESHYDELKEQVKTSDILLFGEQHNSAIAHWLQFELTKDLIQIRKVKLGAEMFERDNQEPLNDFLNNQIDQKGLDTLARLWSNYKTDYAPLVKLAKENKLEFIATNIPRRYASMVFRNGFDVLDTLTLNEKKWIAPLPIAFDSNLPTYQNILTMMGEHGTPELVKAQAIKDATMAFSILENRVENELFIHYNGAYHSDFYEGILWYLKLTEPDLHYKTISTVTQKDISFLDEEHRGKADFIIVVNENVTTTY
ncbi:MAG: ChaN family lipoprotein [Flavobacteriaceae bacterium]|nr:ChaN family lipoprotein [Flavobacteriaceae bacterium]